MDFEAELEKFQPSLDIDKAEAAIYGNSTTDVTDLLHDILTGSEQKKEQNNTNSIEWVEE